MSSGCRGIMQTTGSPSHDLGPQRDSDKSCSWVEHTTARLKRAAQQSNSTCFNLGTKLLRLNNGSKAIYPSESQNDSPTFGVSASDNKLVSGVHTFDQPLNQFLMAASFWNCMNEKLSQQRDCSVVLPVDVFHSTVNAHLSVESNFSTRHKELEMQETTNLPGVAALKSQRSRLESSILYKQSTSTNALREAFTLEPHFICPLCRTRIEPADMVTHFHLELQKLDTDTVNSISQTKRIREEATSQSDVLSDIPKDVLESDARYEKFLRIKHHRSQRQEMIFKLCQTMGSVSCSSQLTS
ncbi:hypothetical protein EG68_00378 [Paragonimus skrjabini miyazakii]|uniref:E3 ubiquitin-protein ligase RNF220 middle domain-containing protein n=1 Tax=Paragonimus skrjabini miyazakii TaxID=59628 RepID=A0A8S9Z921_9TREM|nr:hypothetical protein EG68_00378 [Paragonimus skrjabini miyazakii]